MRLPHSLKWRFALSYTALVLVSIGVLGVYLVGLVSETYESDLATRLQSEAVLVGEQAAAYFQTGDDLSRLDAAADRLAALLSARVTLITTRGAVLADSWEGPAAMPNQAGGQEIRGALETGLGNSTRHSSTIDDEMMYAAVPIQVDGVSVAVARVARPTSELRSRVNRVIAAIVIGALAAAAVSVGLAYWLGRSTSHQAD